MSAAIPMTSQAPRAARIRSRVRDYVVYILIAFAFLGMVFLIEGRWGHDAFIRWGGLAGFTAVLFGYFITDSRQYFRERRFWILTAVLLSVHLTVFAFVLTHVEEWKLMWFMVMLFEYPVFVYLRTVLPYPQKSCREAPNSAFPSCDRNAIVKEPPENENL
ncbi:MAG TPA: hypothetical protein VGR47_09805 [Terracidiphilus sp.]|nr:hypothetical protein [Terracidiphilus sp.]